MALLTTILDSTTAFAVGAATSQHAQCVAFAAPWAGGNVTALYYSAAGTLLRAQVIGPWTIDGMVRRRVVASRSIVSDTHVLAGTAAYIVYRAGSTDIAMAAVGPGGIVLGPIRALCAPWHESVAFEADPSLPLSPARALLAAAPPHSWVQLNAGRNTISSVFAPSGLTTQSVSGPSGQERTLGAWAGMAWNMNRGQIIAGPGGGHANASTGQAFDWSEFSLDWRLAYHQADIVNVSTNPDPISFPVYRSKDFVTPTAAHVYCGPTMLQQLDRYCTFGGAAAGDGGSWKVWDQAIPGAQPGLRAVGCMLLDMAQAGQGKVAGATGSNPAYGAYAGTVLAGANAWQTRDWFGQAIGHPSRPRHWLIGDATEHLNSGAAAEVLGGKDVLYWMAQSRVVFKTVFNDLNPLNDVQTVVGGVDGGAHNAQGQFALDDVRRLLLTVNTSGAGLNNVLMYIDLKRPHGSDSWRAVQLSGTDAVEFATVFRLDLCGVVFNKVAGCFTFWTRGRQVWHVFPPGDLGGSYVDESGLNLTPASGWVVVKQAMYLGGSAPRDTYITGSGPLDETGTLGLLRWASGLNAPLGVMGNATGEVWAYKAAA